MSIEKKKESERGREGSLIYDYNSIVIWLRIRVNVLHDSYGNRGDQEHVLIRARDADWYLVGLLMNHSCELVNRELHEMCKYSLAQKSPNTYY